MAQSALLTVSKRSIVASAIIACSWALPAYGQDLTNNDEFAIVYLGVLGLSVALYGVPSFIAFYRKHPNRWLIMIINIVFGGTGIGWLIALVWACNSTRLNLTGNNGGQVGLNLRANEPRAQSQETELIAQLEKLQALRQSNAIDDAEFEQLKAALMTKVG